MRNSSDCIKEKDKFIEMLKKTLILHKQEIEKLINMRQALRIIEKTFIAQAQGKVQMPAKIYLHLVKYRGDFRAMPAYIEGTHACGIKWVNVHPENRKYGLAAVMAVIILNDPKTGFPLAVMDGTGITNLRTGAAGGIAAKYLANKNSSRVSLVGCGSQAQTQLMALHRLFKIRLVSVYDRDRSKAIGFIGKMNFLGFKIKCCPNIRDCLLQADIVVTTTPSRKPIIKAEWIGSGVHINAIGADAKGKEELEPGILKRAKVVVDNRVQAIHSGEINVPISKKIMKESDIYATLGEVIRGKKKGRISGEEITVFDSTGLAVCDVAVANYVYKEAIRRRLGKYIRLIG
jgi:alanine dehydrogenase